MVLKPHHAHLGRDGRGGRGSEIVTGRPLDASYSIIYLAHPRQIARQRGGADEGGLSGDRREHGRAQGRPVAVDCPDRGRKFWLQLVTELKTRGLRTFLDISLIIEHLMHRARH